jgi:tetratricopeptide (TPR) repeat protein
MKGNSEEAISCYEKASETTPKMSMTKRALAGAYLFAGYPDRAIAELQAVTEGDYKDKERFQAYRDIAGTVLPYLGRFEEAFEMAAVGLDSLQARGDTTILLEARLGMASLYFWGYQDTEQMWKMAETTYGYPDSMKTNSYWMALGALNLITGRTEEGMKVFEAHNKEDLVVPLYQALAAGGQGDCVGADAWLDSVIVIPKSQYTSVIFEVAVCYYQNADYESASRLLSIVVAPGNQMLQNAPAIIFGHYYAAKCYDALGKTSDALNHYRHFLDVWKSADEDQPKLADARGRVAALEAAGSM